MLKAILLLACVYVAVGVATGLAALVCGRRRPFEIFDPRSPLTSFFGTILVWPVVLLAELQQFWKARHPIEGPIRSDWVQFDLAVPESWLREKVLDDPRTFDWRSAGLNPTDNPGMQELLDLVQPGDELWYFSTSKGSWQRMSGRAGYVVIRAGQQVAHLVTMMN